MRVELRRDVDERLHPVVRFEVSFRWPWPSKQAIRDRAEWARHLASIVGPEEHERIRIRALAAADRLSAEMRDARG